MPPRFVRFAPALALLVLLAVPRSHAAAQTSGIRDDSALATIRPRDLVAALGGALSPDGRWLAYEIGEEGTGRIRLLNVARGTTRVLTPRSGSRGGLVWSPDGTRLAYWGDVTLSGHREPVAGIWVLEVATGDERAITIAPRFAFDTDPQWTARGDSLVFQRRSVSEDAPILIVGAHGGEPRLLVSDSTSRENPLLTPDGRRLVYFGARCGAKGAWGVWVANRDGTGSQCLAPLAGNAEHAPTWAPDGRTLYFLAPDSDRRSRVFAIDVEGGRLRRVDTLHADVVRVSVTRAGEVVAHAWEPELRVGLVPVAGGTPLAVAGAVGEAAFAPMWDADGASLFVSAGALTRSEPLDSLRLRRLRLAPSRAAVAGSTSVPTRGGRAMRNAGAARSGGWLAAQGVGSVVVLQHADSAQRWLALGYAESAGGAPDWSPTGDRVVWSSGTHGENSGGMMPYERRLLARNALVVARLDSVLRGPVDSTKGWRVPLAPFPLPGKDSALVAIAPRFSPDGRWIAFATAPDARGMGALFVVPADGGRAREVTRYPTGHTHSGPEWSRDGRWLYFASAPVGEPYALHRVAIEGGAVERVTRGATSVLHPRLSPDGRTLALTLWDAPTRLRVVARVVAASAPATAIARTRAAPRDSARPHPALVDIASRVVRVGAEVNERWPGYWTPRQPFLLHERRGGAALLVGAPAPFARFQAARAEELPPSLRGRVAFGRLRASEVDGISVPSAVVALDTSGVASPAAIERAVFSLVLGGEGLSTYHYELERPAQPTDARYRTEACPTGLRAGCSAARVLERRLLLAAMDAPTPELERALRRYLGVRWLLEANNVEPEAWDERLGGLHYIARRTALLASGGDTLRWAAALRDSLAAIVESDWFDRGTEHFEKRNAEAYVIGQALALLLDRLGAPWLADLRRGAYFSAPLARAIRFDSTMALAEWNGVRASPDWLALLNAARKRVPAPSYGDRESAPHLERFYYERVIHALAPDSLALIVSIPPVSRVPAGRLHAVYEPRPIQVRVVEGAAEGVTLGEARFLPRPERFELVVGDVRVVVREHPVFMQSHPSAAGNREVFVYLPREVTARLRERPGGASASVRQRIIAPGVELEIGPGAQVTRGVLWGRPGVIVTPSPPAPRGALEARARRGTGAPQ